MKTIDKRRDNPAPPPRNVEKSCAIFYSYINDGTTEGGHFYGVKVSHYHASNTEYGPLYHAILPWNKKEHLLGMSEDNMYTCSSHANENTLNDNSPE